MKTWIMSHLVTSSAFCVNISEWILQDLNISSITAKVTKMAKKKKHTFSAYAHLYGII